MACEIIKDNLDKMPGDARALIGFLTFNKSVNFYNLRVSIFTFITSARSELK